MEKDSGDCAEQDKTDLKTNKTSPRLGCTSVIRHHGGISISGCGKSGTRSVSGMEESYACRLLSNLNALRQDSKGFNLCDVEIVAGLDQASKRVHYAHRSVLAAASAYFNAMFTSDVVEAKRDRIVIQSLDSPTLASLLDFMYTGEIEVTNENVQDLLIAGDMIELREVVEICTDHLVRQLEPSNAIGIFRFAADHNCMLLREAALRYVCTNFVQVSTEEEFSDLPRELLLNLLPSEDLRVDSEYQVFQAALSWLEHDVGSRRRFVFDILKHVRLPLVPSKQLDEYQAQCRDLSLQVALNSLMKDVSMRKGSLVCAYAAPRRAAKKFVYVIGGSHRELGSAWTKEEYTYDSVERYDIYAKQWRQVTPMRIARILPGIAVLNGHVFVCGGEVDSQILANGEIYDPHEDTWCEMASMTIPRCEFGMCALDGYLYAFGGWVGEDIGGTIERYNPTKDQWEYLTKMQEPRFSMGICVYDSLIYLVGGCTHSRRHMQELVSYNPVTGEWTSYASMIVPRSQMGCIVMDDCLYVVGGTNRHNEVLQSVERYFFKEDRWQEIPPMLEARASPSVAAVNGKIYVFGGDQIHEVNFYRARTTMGAAEVYDPLTNSWSHSEPLPESRSESGAVVI